MEYGRVCEMNPGIGKTAMVSGSANEVPLSKGSPYVLAVKEIKRASPDLKDFKWFDSIR